jgi:hypothetical protein
MHPRNHLLILGGATGLALAALLLAHAEHRAPQFAAENLPANSAPAREAVRAPVAPTISTPLASAPIDEELRRALAGRSAEEQAAHLDLILPKMTATEIASALPTIEAAVRADMEYRLVWERLGHHWAQHDGEAALVFAATRGTGLLRVACAEAVLAAWLPRAGVAAAEFTTGLPDSAEKEQIIHLAARHWTTTDPAAALPWTRQMPERWRAKAEMHAAQAWIEADAPAFAAWIAAQPATELPSLPVITEVATALARQAAAAAEPWSDSLPTPAARTAARTAIVYLIADRDPQTAGAWLQRYSPSPEMDAPFACYAESVHQIDAPAAEAWAAAITDPALRAATLQRVHPK